MGFKLLIFDLDGTAVPNKPDGLPSEAVIGAVEKAKKFVEVSVATGRAITMARPILKKFNLTSPCIISGGTQIINPQTEETLWEKRLSKHQVERIIQVCFPYHYEILFAEETNGSSAKEKNVVGSERIVYIMNVEEGDDHKMLRELDELDEVAAYGVKSWTKGCTDIHATHKQATKKYAMKTLLEMIGVDKEAVLCVGDSTNDLPLFETSGFKVAMGNASEEIKQLADYIAPSVEEDGMVEVINKLIVSKR